jgi:hypothetical protein
MQAYQYHNFWLPPRIGSGNNPGNKPAVDRIRRPAVQHRYGARDPMSHVPSRRRDNASALPKLVTFYRCKSTRLRKEVPMPVMQPPTGPIEIADPNNVPELFVNGPFNIMSMGGMVQITLTTMRPKANDLFSGKDAAEFVGTIACRLLMPAGLAERLVRTLADTLIKAAQSSETTAPTQARYNEPLSADRKDSRAAPRPPIRFE